MRRDRLFALVAAVWIASGVARSRAEDVPPATAMPAPVKGELLAPEFCRHVLPLLNRLGCAEIRCHGSFHGQNGFALSLFGRRPAQDLEQLQNGRIDAIHPTNSLLLAKPTQRVEHGGGKRLYIDSWEYRLIVQWIENGMPVDLPRQPPELLVEPATVQLRGVEQLQVLARWDDGRQEDVSRLATYHSLGESIVHVDSLGQCHPGDQPGATSVVIRYGGVIAAVTVLAPFSEVSENNLATIDSAAEHGRSRARSGHPVDQFIDARLAQLGLRASPPCDDAEFLRRVTLDVTGQLPTAADYHDFLHDNAPDKRQRKIDSLLETDEYAWRWAAYLAQLSGCDEQELQYAAGELHVTPQQLAFHWADWFHARLAEDLPYNELVRRVWLATSREELSGRDYYGWLERWRAQLNSQFDDDGMYASRATNDLFWRRYTIIHQPELAMESLTESFLGWRLSCARCHDHPSDHWTQADHEGLTAIVQRIQYSELPLEPVEKQRLLYGFTLGSVAISGLFGWGLNRLSHTRFSRLARAGTWTLLAACGVGGIAATSYVHLVFRQTVSQPSSLGKVLYSVSSRWAESGSISGPILALTPGMLLSAACLLFLVGFIRSCSHRPVATSSWGASVAAVAMGALLALTADAYFVAREVRADRAPESLFHSLHRYALRQLGWGGCGQQPREVFVADRFAGSATPASLPNGNLIPPIAGHDPRLDFFQWACEGDTPPLARNIVNHVWAACFGQGLVEPLGDLSDGNPASHPQLFDWLTRDFVRHGWSLRHLHRILLTSAAYSRSSKLVAEQPLADREQAAFSPRRLTCEQLISAIDAVTGVRSQFGSENAPRGASPFQVGVRYPWSDEFGARAMRVIGRRIDERELRLDAALFGLIDPDLRTRISDRDGRLMQAIRSGATDNEILDQLFVVAYSRAPDPVERDRLLAACAAAPARTAGWEAVVWAILNSEEFQFVH